MTIWHRQDSAEQDELAAATSEAYAQLVDIGMSHEAALEAVLNAQRRGDAGAA